MHAINILLALVSLPSLFAHSSHAQRGVRLVGRTQSANFKRASHAPELEELFNGNKQFRASVEPGLLKKLTDDGQSPPFMFIGCSDSRVSEGTVFNAKPGTLFTERNIANQFHHTDANAHSVLSYAVSELGVKHVIVMGHYGCGGVAAAIATPPEASIDAANGAVQNWIAPVREIFQTSNRPEIVELREKIKGVKLVEEPEPQEPGFRALVEENVKAGVRRIATDSVLTNHYALLASKSPGAGGETKPSERRDGHAKKEPGDVFVHGWVYDIENGEIRDLGISVGPPGKVIPPAPFPAVEGAAKAQEAGQVPNVAVGPLENSSSKESPEIQCAELCKGKRNFLGN